MMHMRALALVLLVACTSDPADDMPHDIGKTVIELCGQPPNTPSYGASFNGDTATMATATYVVMDKSIRDLAAWRDCVVSIP